MGGGIQVHGNKPIKIPWKQINDLEKKKTGATAEHSPRYYTAARLEFKSCLQMLFRVRVVFGLRAVLE